MVQKLCLPGLLGRLGPLDLLGRLAQLDQKLCLPGLLDRLGPLALTRLVDQLIRYILYYQYNPYYRRNLCYPNTQLPCLLNQ